MSALQMPGSPAGPPAGTGAATAPGPQAGSAQQGMTLVKTALETLQSALSRLALGSDVHAAVLKSVTELAKHMSQGPEDQGDKMQQLAQIARQTQQGGGQTAQLAKMMPQPGQLPAAAA